MSPTPKQRNLQTAPAKRPIRRARNIISRHAELAAAAAAQLDTGATDADVAAALAAQFPGQPVTPRAVAAYRRRDYAAVERERTRRREAAAQVAAIMDGAAGTYARAAQDLLSRMLYQLLDATAAGTEDGLAGKDLIAAGKTLAKIREIEIAQIRAENENLRTRQANAAADAAGDVTLTPEQRQHKIKEALGLS